MISWLIAQSDGHPLCVAGPLANVRSSTDVYLFLE